MEPVVVNLSPKEAAPLREEVHTVTTRLKCITYGSFILMKSRHIKNGTTIQTKPKNRSKNLLSLGRPGPLALSRMTYPSPPTVNKKLEASPSMMYWPFTLYGINAT